MTVGDFVPVGHENVLMDLHDIVLQADNTLSFEDTCALVDAQVKFESVYGDAFVANADIHPVARDRKFRALKQARSDVA